MARRRVVDEMTREELEGRVCELWDLVDGLELEVASLRTEFDDLKKSVSFKPRSQRAMTEEDARRVVLGDMASKPSKQAAVLMGLSYGQVYSARNGYTFKEVYDEKQKSVQKKKEAELLREVRG
jgi:hypothetical protein